MAQINQLKTSGSLIQTPPAGYIAMYIDEWEQLQGIDEFGNSGSLKAAYAATASMAERFTPGDKAITGSLIVTQDIIAQNYIVSSSVTNIVELNASGSSKFGDSLDDTHQMTGSLLVTGSAGVIGDVTITGSLLQTGSYNLQGNITASGTISASLGFTGSIFGVAASASFVISSSVDKEWHVSSGSGNDTTGDGSPLRPFKTIGKAISVAGNTGERIVVHPGTYVEAVTMNKQNLLLIGSDTRATGGEVFISGSINLSPTTSSLVMGVSNIRTLDIVMNNQPGTYVLNNIQVDRLFAKAVSASVEVQDSKIQVPAPGSAYNYGNGIITFKNCSVSYLYTDQGSTTQYLDCPSVLAPTMNSGSVVIRNSTVYAESALYGALRTQPTSVTTLQNSQFYYVGTTTPAPLILSGSYALANVVGLVSASTATNRNTTAVFNSILSDTLVTGSEARFTNITGSLRGIATSASFVISSSINREWHVSPGNTGNDTTGDGSALRPFKTISQSLLFAGNSGEQIILHPGTYTEDITVTQQNLSILGSSGTTRGEIWISGSVTFSAPGSSNGLYNVRVNNLTLANSGSLYTNEVSVNQTFNKTGVGYAEITDTNLQGSGVNITGPGTALFQGCLMNFPTVNNAAAVVSILQSAGVVQPTVTAGTVLFQNAFIYAAVSGTSAINSSATSNVFLNNASVINASNQPERVTLLGTSSLNNTTFNRTNSTLATNLNSTINFDNLYTSGSINSLNGIFRNGLVVSGSFTVVSSSTEFSVLGTGVKMGNSGSDSHQITGSINISGSTFFTGSVNIATSQSLNLGISSSLNFAPSSSLNFGTSSSLNISGSTPLTVSGSINMSGSFILNGKPVGSGGATVSVTGSAPVDPITTGSLASGSLWYNTNVGNLFVQVQGPTGSVWVPATTSIPGGTYGSTGTFPFTNTSTVNINHNFNTTTPIVQVYSGSQQIIPATIQAIDANNLRVTFAVNTTGNVIISTGTNGAQTSVSASYAVSSSQSDVSDKLGSPIYCVEAVNTSVGINTSGVTTYAGSTIVNPQSTNWNLRYYRGGFSISSNQLYVSRIGYWKVKWDFSGIDAGGANTTMAYYIGVNNVYQAARATTMLSGGYGYGHIETVVAVTNVSHPIDFRAGTSSGELFTINNYYMELEWIGY